jgi:hypothetical protein
MPAHAHPGPGCRAVGGRPCASGTTCSHPSCLKGGPLLLCEEMKGGGFYCFHAEYYSGADIYSGKPALVNQSAIPDPLPPFVPPPHTAMQKVAARFKDTYDLAGAAVAVLRANSGICWSVTTSFNPSSIDHLLEVESLRMCCYEFVHFAAFLAGRQRVSSGGIPLVSGACGTLCTPNRAVYDGEWLQRGKLVVGVAPIWNNSNGYYHVGISLGGWRVISLSGGKNIHVDTIDGLFPKSYKEVRIGDYNWITAQNDARGRTSISMQSSSEYDLPLSSY